MSNQGDIASSSTSVATVDTVDTPEFRNHLLTYWANNESVREIAAKHLIAHIDSHVSAQVAAERLRADNADGMAECMRMFRDDMISAGIIGADVAPMFMSEAIMRVVAAKGAEIARLTHERDVLGQAIADAARKAGIANEDVSLTGPHLLMLAGDLADVALSAQAEAPVLTDLHAQIMNLPCNPKLNAYSNLAAYELGHCDARHAAAELVASQPLPANGGAYIEKPILRKQQWHPLDTRVSTEQVFDAVYAGEAKRNEQSPAPSAASTAIEDRNQTFLNWCADRFVHVYGENPNVDFVLKLRKLAAAQSPAPVAMTNRQIIEVVARIASHSLNVTRLHEVGGKTTTIMDEEGVIEIARAILAAQQEAV